MRPHITSFGGKRLHLLDLQPRDIKILDIAHALALINRFNGHTKFPISVAQHSVYVARISNSLQGLLHDASEAYLGDVTKYLKESPMMIHYRKAETAIQKMIFRTYGCPTKITAAVEWADRLMVRFEHEMGYGQPIDIPGYGPTTYEERNTVNKFGDWRPMNWKQAKKMFLREFFRR